MEKNDVLTHLQLVVGRISALTNPVTYIIINAATIILLYTGAVRVDNGSITQGEVVALVNYMSQILVELIKLANLIITITKALACANRIEAVFEVESSMEWRDTAEEGKGLTKTDNRTAGDAVPAKKSGTDAEASLAVEFDHVHLTYGGAGAESLSDIHIQVPKGQTVGIIGGTGSGKSSLVNMIPRFYDATTGAVRVDGRDVKTYGMEELREKIGIVLQKAVLFRGTIRDNLLWGNGSATDEELWGGVTARAGKGVCGDERGTSGCACGAGGTKPFRRAETTAYNRKGAGGEARDTDSGRQCVCVRLCDGRGAPQGAQGAAWGTDGVYRIPACLLHSAR